MGEIINNEHPPCTKKHWCENHCYHRFESEGGMPSCICDQFDDDDEYDDDNEYDADEDDLP